MNTTQISYSSTVTVTKFMEFIRLLSESCKYQGCPILGTQTEAKIIDKYGLQQTRTILQGTKTKLILGCADPQTSETMAKIIGKQKFCYTAENHSRSRHTGKSGNGRTVTLNEQLRESYAVMPEQLANLPDLKGYLKIAEYCAPIGLKPRKFAACARKFVLLLGSSLTDAENESIALERSPNTQAKIPDEK